MLKIVCLKELLTVAICSLSLSAFAQLGPQTNGTDDHVFSHQFSFLNKRQWYFIDTSFNSLHWYHQFNHANKDLFGHWQFTNDGGALQPLRVHSRINENIWEPAAAGPYAGYFADRNEIPFYHVRSALTEANYWMGYGRGQSFNFYHTQNITKNWNALVNFRRLNSTGVYSHNRNAGSRFLVSSRYRSSKGLYSAHAYLNFEKLEIDEFGGLEEVDEFIAEPPGNKALAQVNLDRDRRYMRKRNFLLDQNIDLLKLFASFAAKKGSDSLQLKSEADTNQLDSSTTVVAAAKVEETESSNNFRLGHSVQFTHQSRVYRQYDGEFYQDYFRTVPSPQFPVTDSLSTRTLRNTLYLETNLGQKSSFHLKAGIQNLVTRYDGYGFRLSTNNLGLVGNIKGKLSDLISVDGSLDLIATGSLRETFNAEANGSLKLFKSLRAVGGYRINHSYPDFYYQLYFGNNYIWQEIAEKQIHGSAQLGLRWGKSNKLMLANHSFTNYTYFTEGAPQQASQVVKANQIMLTQNFTLWNFLHQDNDIVYQQVSGDQAALPLPEWLSRNSLYFEFYLFNRALKCLAGTEMNYFTAYYAPEYNSAIGELENQQEQQRGDYPVFDVFANFELAKARIFIKYAHLNQGFSGNDFFLSPTYPMAERALRVGITWRFFN